MTHTAFVAIGIVLIAFVVYLAIEQRGQDIVWYDAMSNALGEADAYELDSANALLTVAGVHASDPARPGEEKVTYTLNAVDQSPVYRLNGGSPITASHPHALDFVDGTCMTNTLVGDGGGGARLTSTMDCTFAPMAHGEHDTAFYYNGTSAGDATGVDVTSANTALLTVGGAVAADTLRTGQNRMTYTLTPTDPSPEYEVGASNIQATHPYDVDFRQGACIAQTIGGTPSNVQVTTSFDASTTPCMFAPATHAHPHTHPTEINAWTFRCGGTLNPLNTEVCDFEIESGVRQTRTTATTNTFRDDDDDLEFRVTGNYLLDLKLELHFIAPGSILEGAGQCSPPNLRQISSAVAVAPSPLFDATPMYSPDYIDGNTTPMPRGNVYCDSNGNTIPDVAGDIAVTGDIRGDGQFEYRFSDDDPETLAADNLKVTRDTRTAAGAYHPLPVISTIDVTDVTSAGDEIEFSLDQLGGENVLDRARTKLHLVIIQLSP